MRRLTTTEWIKKAIAVHGDKYSYTNTIYTKAKDPVSIVCLEHGVFTQTAQHHISGHGCPKCSNNYNYTNEEFIEKANKVHNNKYTYKNCVYSNNKTKVKITCPIHGDFEQTPDSHLKGQDCPSCVKNGFDPTKAAILYYLKITVNTGKVLYKIGITNRSVNERFNLKELSKIEIIKQRTYEVGQDAYNKEQEILKKYKDYKYKGPPVLESGNTELFVINILA